MENLEIKTTSEIFQAHRKVMNPENPQPMNIYLDSAKKKWVSEDSLGRFIDSQKDFANLTAFELWVRLQKELEGNNGN